MTKATTFTVFICSKQTFRHAIMNRLPTCFGRISLLAFLFYLGASALSFGQSLSASMPFPAFNSSYIAGTQINIQVNATTPAGTSITKVEFFVAENFGAYTKIGEDVTTPYSQTWTVPTPVQTSRSYQIRALVTNSASNTAISNAGVGYNSIRVYLPSYSSSRDWYVSATASSTNTAGTEALPFNTIQKAADAVAPGDNVYVMAGTYTATSTNIVQIQRTGLPNKWITFKPYQNDKPILQLGNNNWNGFNVLPAAAYINIQGFEVIGNNASITLPQAQTQPGSCEGANPTATPIARYNGNGISVSGRGGENIRPHHIVLANNKVHDCAGGGFSSIEGDYITIEDNLSYNNSWYTVYGTSGISLFNSWNYDNATDTKMIVRRNICYGNILKIAWNIGGTGTNCKFYDGNGIILDNNNASKNPNGAYAGKFLVENNITYLNGGRGININYTDNALIINNTTYQNGQSDGGFGIGIDNELIMQGSAGARIYNNIFYGKSGESPSSVATSTDVLHNNNLTFGGSGNGYFTSNQNIVGQNPLFVDATNGDFRLLPTSPALNMGSTTASQFAVADLRGVVRPQGTGIEIGAYETPAISVQPVSGSAVCIGAPVSVSVAINGPVQSYQWYKDGTALTGVTSATTAILTLPSATTTDAGSYSAVVVTAFATLTSTAFSLTVGVPPSVSISAVPSLTLSCAYPSLTLTAATSVTGLRWSGGATSTTLAVNAIGMYSLTATSAIGCTALATANVESNTIAPTASLLPAAATLTCANPSLTLTAGSGVSATYTFSGGTTLGTDKIVITNSGTYSVIVTAANGCTNVASTSISQENSLPSLSVNPISSTLTCTNLSQTLTATSSSTALKWSDGSTATTLVVNTQGTYTVTATAPNGCTLSAVVNIDKDTAPPTATLLPISSTLTCPQPSVLLTANGGLSYSFNTGLTSSTLLASSAGTYSAIVTGTNGCTTSVSASVYGNPTPPTVSISPATTLIMSGQALSLSASGATNYAWSTLSSLTTISVSPVVNTVYSVTGTNANGCFSVATATVAVHSPVSLSASNMTLNGSSVLTATNCPATLKVLGWGKAFVLQGPNGYGFSNIFREFILGTPISMGQIKTPGSYTLTIYGDPDQTPVNYTMQISGMSCP